MPSTAPHDESIGIDENLANNNQYKSFFSWTDKNKLNKDPLCVLPVYNILKGLQIDKPPILLQGQGLPASLISKQFLICGLWSSWFAVNLKRICHRSVKLSTAVSNHITSQRTFIKTRFDGKKNADLWLVKRKQRGLATTITQHSLRMQRCNVAVEITQIFLDCAVILVQSAVKLKLDF